MWSTFTKGFVGFEGNHLCILTTKEGIWGLWTKSKVGYLNTFKRHLRVVQACSLKQNTYVSSQGLRFLFCCRKLKKMLDQDIRGPEEPRENVIDLKTKRLKVKIHVLDRRKKRKMSTRTIKSESRDWDIPQWMWMWETFLKFLSCAAPLEQYIPAQRHLCYASLCCLKGPFPPSVWFVLSLIQLLVKMQKQEERVPLNGRVQHLCDAAVTDVLLWNVYPLFYLNWNLLFQAVDVQQRKISFWTTNRLL